MAAEPRGADGDHDLPLGSFVVLRAADGLASPKVLPTEEAEFTVVLLHGWLQDLGSWLTTAQRLRDRRRADVLLVDFYAHGASPELRGVQMHTVDALVMQVRRIVEHLGWQRRGLVLGGMSMGASVALHYAHCFPAAMRGVLLVAPSGMPERINPLPHIGAQISRALLGGDTEKSRAGDAGARDGGSEESTWRPSTHRRSSRRFPPAEPPVPREPPASAPAASSRSRAAASSSRPAPSMSRRALSKLNFIKRTPMYGHDETSLSAAAEFGWPATVVLARFDVLHTPQETEWRAKAPHAQVLMVPMTHWWMCTHVDDLALEEDPLWDAVRAASPAPAPAAPRRAESSSAELVARATEGEREPSLAGVSSLEEGLSVLRESRVRRSKL